MSIGAEGFSPRILPLWMELEIGSSDKYLEYLSTYQARWGESRTNNA
jgi:hypothetical protein